ncbi:uncharacterized protein [Palaemon carinicauda]|uniref:uncharacterized protein n=1 Tax=Palaemon carinicauda TaxID=392227 RepID=UPI0035B6863E
MKTGSILVIAICIGIVAGGPSTEPPSEAKDPSQVLMKRDDQQHHHHPQHTAPAAPYDSYSSYAETGANYYYQPVEEVEEHEPKKDYCPVDTVLAPIIVITIFAGVLAGNALGLVPRVQFQLPQQTINAINALKPDPLGIKPPIIGPPGTAWIPAIPARSLGTGRADDFMGNATQTVIDEMTAYVTDIIEQDECGTRFVCEIGKYAEGNKRLLGIMHFLTPAIYRNKMKIFKDSALKKCDCDEFRCGFIDDNEI